MRTSPWLICIVASVLVLAQACLNEPTPEGPTPVERMLAESADPAAEDSLRAHINFDYENLNRVVWQKPDEIIALLGTLRGKTVVEVGSGTGFFTRRLARTADKVIALDIDPGMLLLLDSLNAEQLDPAAYARVDPRLVPADTPNLGDGEADAALLVNTFMYIRDGPAYLRELAGGLQPGSTVLVVDFKAANTPVGPPVSRRLPATRVEDALRRAGYRDIVTDEHTLAYQYIVRGVVSAEKDLL